jgi:adenine-specific DNA-methyltransferase
MKPVTKTILKSFDKAYKIQPVSRTEIETFKTNYIKLIDRVEESESRNESEENFKGHLMDFLKNTYFQKNTDSASRLVAPKGKTDFVIHTTNEGSSPAAILFEVKRPKNTAEMVSRTNLNTKAMQELMLYYFEERSKHQNNDITHLIITNIHEWFIFESNTFERLFYKNSKLLKDFKDWKDGKKVSRTNDLFYNEIAKPALNSIDESIEFTYFDIRTYEKNIRNTDLDDDKKLIELYKVFSPTHLLKLQATNDNNKLNSKFYSELLHIIGLEEVKDGGKKLIQRKAESSRNEGSLLENCINMLENEDRLHHVKDLLSYGKGKDEQNFNIGLELCITWINRILFLKLLEAQLQKYHDNDQQYRFLNSPKIQDFDVLNKLFFQVLAKPIKSRSESIQAQFSQIPYLNSSLFDISPLEDDTIRINSLDDSLSLPLLSSSVLRKNTALSTKKQVNTLEYLFGFLDAYDFASENKEDIVEENRELISASVLGLIFEKINGYRDGSFYTPAFITEYMCKETITKAVIEKFNETKDWNCSTLTDLHNKIDNIKEANQIFDSLHICDPAVGSGHFLVSALNALIFTKAEIGILQDRNGKRLKGYTVEVINDELIVLDEEKVFEYKVLPNGKVNAEIQRVQETLFYEKQTLIENCLFGVDINPNSVKICRLRLWIELLKNAYYTSESTFSELETLPNIDINIKQGNSLVSRYDVKTDISEILKKSKYSVNEYRKIVGEYKNATNKEEKKTIEKTIEEIKNNFRTEIAKYSHPDVIKLQKLTLELNNKYQNNQLFDIKLTKAQKNDKLKLENEIEKLTKGLQEIKDNVIFKGAFEWRFEFPEILDDKGDFVGFDVVIGNPPYMRVQEIEKSQPNEKIRYEDNYKNAKGAYDLANLFFELAINISNQKANNSFIFPHKFFNSASSEVFRNYLVLDKYIDKIAHFGANMVFEDADTYTCIAWFSKQQNEGFYFQKFPYKSDFQSLMLKNEDYGLMTYEMIKKASELYGSNQWIMFNDSKGFDLFKKMYSESKTFNDSFEGIYQGLATSKDDLYILEECSFENELLTATVQISKRIYQLETDLFKPFLMGKDVQRYANLSTNKYVFFPYLVEQNQVRIVSISEIKEKYPLTYIYLVDHEKQFKARESGKAGKMEHWHTYIYPKNLNKFEQPKLSSMEICSNHPNVTYNLDNFYHTTKVYSWVKKETTKESYEYLLAIANSKLLWWFLKLTGDTLQGDARTFKTNYLNPFPIPSQVSAEREAQIKHKVEQILAAKKADPNTDTTQLESEIDAMVYKLYNLTPEEIAIVEGK